MELIDEVEEFKIKRSSHSRRVAKQLKKESRKEKEDRERLEREAANAIQVKQLNLVMVRPDFFIICFTGGNC